MPNIDYEEEDRNTLYCVYELWENSYTLISFLFMYNKLDKIFR